MSAALLRVLAAPVRVSIHAVWPGSSGFNPIAESNVLTPLAFYAFGNTILNQYEIELRPTIATGVAAWVAVWVDGQVRATGRLRQSLQAPAGSIVYFPRGDIRLSWKEGV